MGILKNLATFSNLRTRRETFRLFPVSHCIPWTFGAAAYLHNHFSRCGLSSECISYRVPTPLLIKIWLAINTPISYSPASVSPMPANPDQPSLRSFTTPVQSADNSSMVARRWGVLRNAVGFMVRSRSGESCATELIPLQGRMKSILSRSDGGRRRKALLIGINYNNTAELPLHFPQCDTQKMRQLLQGAH